MPHVSTLLVQYFQENVSGIQKEQYFSISLEWTCQNVGRVGENLTLMLLPDIGQFALKIKRRNLEKHSMHRKIGCLEPK